MLCMGQPPLLSLHATKLPCLLSPTSTYYTYYTYYTLLFNPHLFPDFLAPRVTTSARHNKTNTRWKLTVIPNSFQHTRPRCVFLHPGQVGLSLLTLLRRPRRLGADWNVEPPRQDTGTQWAPRGRGLSRQRRGTWFAQFYWSTLLFLSCVFCSLAPGDGRCCAVPRRRGIIWRPSRCW
jgi:hypothetical protein